MRIAPRTFAASIVLAALAIAGCSSDSKSSSTTATQSAPAPASATTAPASGDSTAAAGGATLEIKGFKFGAVDAKAGDAITVKDADSAAHTVTADDGSFEVKVGAGGTATLTVDKAGTYAIHCEIHKQMKGSITIG